MTVKKCTFCIRSVDRDQFKTSRIHWAPLYLPDDVITNDLFKYGKVHVISFETSVSKGFEGVRTGVRSVVTLGWKQNIPHIIPLCEDGEVSQLVVTIASRQPPCLQCRHKGHFHRECSTPFCRHYAQFGHFTEMCAAAGSYASALRESTRVNNAESVNIEEEEMEQGEGVNEEAGVVKRVEGEKVIELFNAVIDLRYVTTDTV